jgi:hypothetical protein
MLQQINKKISFNVKVTPKAARSEIVGWKNGELRIRLAAVPEKGAANSELIRFLAEILGIGKTKIELIKGETSRHKRISVTSLSMTELEEKLKIKNLG